MSSARYWFVGLTNNRPEETLGDHASMGFEPTNRGTNRTHHTYLGTMTKEPHSGSNRKSIANAIPNLGITLNEVKTKLGYLEIFTERFPDAYG
jgi:hypothetical protein